MMFCQKTSLEGLVGHFTTRINVRLVPFLPGGESDFGPETHQLAPSSRTASLKSRLPVHLEALRYSLDIGLCQPLPSN